MAEVQQAVQQGVPHDVNRRSRPFPIPQLHSAYGCGEKAKHFFNKYFFEGQRLQSSAARKRENIPVDATFEQRIWIKYRKYIAFILPVLLFQIVWWLTAIRHNFLPLYATHWQMPVTMVFGSIVAGMTSEGGGAVAFPVMTLVLHIDPKDARDFSFMIQSCGMTTALAVIVLMKVRVEWRVITVGTLGAIPGLIVGLYLLDPLFSAAQKKMLFVSLWSAFAISLAILNSHKKRTTYLLIPEFKFWKAAVLFATGFVGGIFNSFAGSGIDICLFSVITLLFRVTEKTATPTTVIAMGINTVIGFYWRAVMMGDIAQLAWDYFKIASPVASAFASLGSFVGSHFHRQLLASLVYILETLAVIGFLITRPAWTLISCGAFIILFGYVFFSLLSRIGERVMEGVEERRSMNVVSALAYDGNRLVH